MKKRLKYSEFMANCAAKSLPSPKKEPALITPACFFTGGNHDCTGFDDKTFTDFYGENLKQSLKDYDDPDMALTEINLDLREAQKLNEAYEIKEIGLKEEIEALQTTIEEKETDIDSLQEQRDEYKEQVDQLEEQIEKLVKVEEPADPAPVVDMTANLPKPTAKTRYATMRQIYYLVFLVGCNYYKYTQKWQLTTKRASNLITAAINLKKGVSNV